MTGAIVGTPHYMAPEQVQGQAVDGRADQFSLAVIAFEMLTGEKPFTGEQLTTVVYKIVAEEPGRPHRLNSTLNQQITNVLRRALAKKPDARYPQLPEIRGCAGSRLRGRQGLAAVAARRQPQPAHGRGSAAACECLAIPRDRRNQARERRKVRALPVMLAILVAAGLVVLIAWQAAPWLTDQVPSRL